MVAGKLRVLYKNSSGFLPFSLSCLLLKFEYGKSSLFGKVSYSYIYKFYRVFFIAL